MPPFLLSKNKGKSKAIYMRLAQLHQPDIDRLKSKGFRG